VNRYRYGGERMVVICVQSALLRFENALHGRCRSLRRSWSGRHSRGRGDRVRERRHQPERTEAARSGCYVKDSRAGPARPGPARPGRSRLPADSHAPRGRRSVTTTTAFVVPPLSGDSECQKLVTGAPCRLLYRVETPVVNEHSVGRMK